MSRRDLDEWLWQVGAELQRISEEITPAKPNFARSAYWQPRIDVVESEYSIIIIAEIAGVSLHEVRVVYDGENHRLILRGQRQQLPLIECCGSVHQLEISYGEFEREITLPAIPLLPDETKVDYRDGFLVMHIPKVERVNDSAPIRRRIVIHHEP